MFKLGYKIDDLGSAERKIQSFSNALTICSILPITFLLIIAISMQEFPMEMVEPFVSCDILFVLSLLLKITKSRALSIIIFILLLDSFVSGLLTSTGLPKSGTFIAFLLTISAVSTIKATYLRYKLLNGKTIVKNIIIKNLIGIAYSVIFIFITCHLIILWGIMDKSIATNLILPNVQIIAEIVLFSGLILYPLTLIDKLPFTKNFPMVVYSRNDTKDSE